MKNKKFLATIALIIVAIIWGSGFLFTKLLLDQDETGEKIGPFYFLFLRMGIAALLLTPYVLLRHRQNFSKDKVQKNAFLGVFLALAFLTLTIGADHTTPSKNAFLNTTHVIFTPLLLFIFYKVKIRINVIVAIIFTTIGVLLLTMNGGHGSAGASDKEFFGDMFSLLGGLFFAFHIMFINKFNKKTSPIFMAYIQFIVATIIFFIAILISGEKMFIFSNQKIFFLMYLVLLNTILSFVLQIWAQKYLEPTKASLILLTEAMFATLFSVIFYDERFTGLMIVGFVLIFGSLIIAELNLRKKKALHLPHIEDIH